MRGDELHAAAVEVRILSAIISKLLRRDMEQHLEMCGAGVGSLQYAVLRLLAHQHYTIAELSRKMMLEAATLVPAIDALEKNGFVERGKDPLDRRRTPLNLTTRGDTLLAHTPSVSPSSRLVQSLNTMGEAKSRQLVGLLRELAGHLTDDEALVVEIATSVRRQIAQEKTVAGQRHGEKRKVD